MKKVDSFSKRRERDNLEPLFEEMAAQPGQVFQLTQGEDFMASANTVAGAAYYYAKSRRMKAHVSVISGAMVEVQFTDDDGKR